MFGGMLPGSAATKDQPIQVGAPWSSGNSVFSLKGKMELSWIIAIQISTAHTHYIILLYYYYIYIYTYIDIYNIHIHLITSYTQQLQSDNIIYICSENDSYSEVFTNYDSYQLSGVAIITVLDGLNSSDVGWRLMQLWVLPAVILVAAERLGCLWMVVDGYPRARSLPDTDGYELLPAVCSLQKCRVPEVQTFKQFLRKACECHQILNPESGTLSATLAAKNESVSMLS